MKDLEKLVECGILPPEDLGTHGWSITWKSSCSGERNLGYLPACIFKNNFEKKLTETG